MIKTSKLAGNSIVGIHTFYIKIAVVNILVNATLTMVIVG